MFVQLNVEIILVGKVAKVITCMLFSQLVSAASKWPKGNQTSFGAFKFSLCNNLSCVQKHILAEGSGVTC